MADPVLDFLREKFRRVEDRLEDLTAEVRAIRAHGAARDVEMQNVLSRLGRIERRLEVKS